MPANTLPLVVVNEKETAKTWEDLATPNDVIRYIASRLAVDPRVLNDLEELIYSTSEPTGENYKKPYIKTSAPYAFGFWTGNRYAYLWEYTPNTIALWSGLESDFPDYLTRIPTTELEEYGLTAPTNGAFWYKFTPPIS